MALSLFIAIAVFCFGGCGYYVADRIDDYDSFVNGYAKYGKIQILPGGVKAENIEGFTPVVDYGFDYGGNFSGGAAFVKDSFGFGLLDLFGNVIKSAEDLSGKQIASGKYVYESGGLLGVMSIFGYEILEARYDAIEIKESTVLAIKGNTVETYSGIKLIGRAEKLNEAHLLDKDFVLIDGVIKSLEFTEMRECGNLYLDVPNEGKVLVKTEGGRAGFADIYSHEMIGKTYVAARSFTGGTAVALTDDGTTVVIDECGNEIYSERGIKIGVFGGGYYCYLSGNMYGVLDENFEDITGAVFEFVRYEKAVSGYLIVRSGLGETLYSLDKLAYENLLFDTIEYDGGLFFCKTENETVILDSEASELMRCEYAAWGENVLTVKKDGKYFYYIRSGQ